MKNTKAILSDLDKIKIDAESIIKRIEIIKKELGFSEEKHKSIDDEHNKNNHSCKKEFIEYLRNVVKVKESSIDDYIKDLKRVKKLIGEFTSISLNCEVYEIKDLQKIKTICKELYSNEEFVKLNRKKHHHFSAPLNNYIDFLEYMNNSFDFDD